MSHIRMHFAQLTYKSSRNLKNHIIIFFRWIKKFPFSKTYNLNPLLLSPKYSNPKTIKEK
jgi:hypothetical protein